MRNKTIPCVKGDFTGSFLSLGHCRAVMEQGGDGLGDTDGTQLWCGQVNVIYLRLPKGSGQQAAPPHSVQVLFCFLALSHFPEHLCLRIYVSVLRGSPTSLQNSAHWTFHCFTGFRWEFGHLKVILTFSISPAEFIYNPETAKGKTSEESPIQLIILSIRIKPGPTATGQAPVCNSGTSHLPHFVELMISHYKISCLFHFSRAADPRLGFCLVSPVITPELNVTWLTWPNPREKQWRVTASTGLKVKGLEKIFNV